MTKFTFATVKEGFDTHINASIRGYSDLWNDTLKLSEYFVEDNTNVVDIGCSTGKLLVAMNDRNTFVSNVKYIGIEVERSFQNDLLKAAKNQTNISFVLEDFIDYSKSSSFRNCSYITSIFTLQFMKPQIRQTALNAVYKALNDNGAFVFSEKVYAQTSKLQDMMTFMYYDYKKQSFSEKEILDKESELRHMLKPVKQTKLVDELMTAGFSKENIQFFWQNHLFVGGVALK